MNKKNIGLLIIAVIILICVGFGFNSVLSKSREQSDIIANEQIKDNDNKSNTSLTTTKENNEDNKEKSEENDKNEEVITDSEENTEKDDEKITTDNIDSNTKQDNSEEVVIKPEEKPETETKPEVKPEAPKPEPQPEIKKSVTVAISCNTAINNGLNNEKEFAHLPSNGVILGEVSVEFNEGDTVFDILQKVTSQNGIHMEYTGSGSTIYIEGIHNLYEFDGGERSGWMYSVNGWYPNYGCGSYTVEDGDIIRWNYTCDLGNDL